MSGTDVRRAVISALVVGLIFAAILVVSRALLGGRAIPFWLENTAGIWFVAAFVAGVFARRPLPGAGAGAAALVVGLVAHDSIWFVTGDGFSVQLVPVVRPLWVVISVVVGVALGVLGGWGIGARRRLEPAVGVVSGLLIGEAVALTAGGVPHPAFDPWVGVGQVVVGVVALAAVSRGRRRWQPAAVAAGVALVLVAAELATGVVGRIVWG